MSVELLSDSDLLNLEPLEWLVKGFLALDSKASFWGKPGSYKSFVAFDLAASIAAGFRAWQSKPATSNRSTTYEA